MPSAGVSSVLLQGHALGSVVGVKAVLRVPLAAGAALAAHRAPVQHDEVAGGDVGDVRADRVDHAGRLVAEQKWVRVLDIAVAVGQVRMAHAGGLDFHHHIVRARLGDNDSGDLDVCALLAGDYSLNLLCSHTPPPYQLLTRT